jgi:hypothetical protein
LTDRILKKYPEYNAQLDNGVASAPQPKQPYDYKQDPYFKEEPGLESPDLLPGLVEPANLVPTGIAMKAGSGLVRAAGAKALEGTLKYIPSRAGSAVVPNVLPKVVAATAPPVEQRLLEALKVAKRGRIELSKQYHQTRQKLSGGLGDIQSQGKGEESIYNMLGYLKGKKLADNVPEFDPLRSKLTQQEIDGLVAKVNLNDKLRPFERLKANEGLLKIFEGHVPQPAEMALLKDVFGRETVQEISKLRPWSTKTIDFITAGANMPRAIMASFDASAPLRQGLIMTVSHPKLASQAFKESWKQTFNPVRYAEWLDNLKGHKLYDLMEQSKLYIADPTREAAGLAGKEERFMTETTIELGKLKEKLPEVGKVIERAINMGLAPIRASERNYTTYLNKLRVDTFSQMADEFINSGMLPEENPELYKSLAQYVNSATGRGSMAGFQRSAQVLNAVFFSPRLIKARLDILSKYANPLTSVPWPVRKKALQDMGKTMGAGLTFVGLAKLGGAKVETDPKSSDYMKPRIGNTRLDPWGGFQQFIKLFARLGTNETKTGGQVKKLEDIGSNRYEELGKFLRYKQSPVVAYGREWLENKKTMGEEFEYLQSEKLLPMVYQDIKEVYKENPSLLFATVPLAFFGMGTQTYKQKASTF